MIILASVVAGVLLYKIRLDIRDKLQYINYSERNGACLKFMVKKVLYVVSELVLSKL